MDDGGAPDAPVLMGRYALGLLLGRGGMGTVYDATDLRLARPVAVKILRADLAAHAVSRRRFETEAHAAARLTHPNVVMVFDSGEDHGIPFLVMERLPGRTLADELAAGPLPPERVRTVACQVLAALAAAHGAGVIHRDIKPANILLTADGGVKVSDFGIAKTIDDLDQTQTVEVLASPGYVAPERLAGQPASPQSDLYSVGVLLYEALSGRRPFVADSQFALVRAIGHGHAAPLTSVRPGLPADLVAVVQRAMDLDPARRFTSAADMARALSAPVDGAGVATVPLAAGNAAGYNDGATRRIDVPAAAAIGGTHRSRVRRAGLAVVLVAVFAALLTAGLLATRGGGPTHPATPARVESLHPVASTTTTVTAPPSTVSTSPPAPPTTRPRRPDRKKGPGPGHGPPPKHP